ncbi:MAG: hypothetical protein WC655_28400, partial [Candidatus Hydrogenedentales bacterium]
MKKIFITAAFAALVTLVGCDQGTSGGPGATTPKSEEGVMEQAGNMIKQAEDTFSLNVPSTSLHQGESATVTIGIDRGKNFSEEVSLKLGELPKGVSVDPTSPVIKHGDTEATFALKAAEDAALGDFTVSVTGHPTKGADAVAEAKITVKQLDSTEAASATGEAAQEKWEEYTVAMQKQLDVFKEKYGELKERASKAEGQTKTDLEAKRAQAEVKLDEAGRKLDELKSASADRWEKV